MRWEASAQNRMATAQEIKGYLIERYRDLGLIEMVETYR